MEKDVKEPIVEEVQQIEEEHEIKSKEDLLIDELKSQTDENRIIRKELIEILRHAAKESNIAYEGNAKLLSAKTEIFSTLNSILDSNTKDAAIIAKTVMAKKEADINDEIAKYTVSMLKNINLLESRKTSAILSEEDEELIDEKIDSIETEPITDAEKQFKA